MRPIAKHAICHRAAQSKRKLITASALALILGLSACASFDAPMTRSATVDAPKVWSDAAPGDSERATGPATSLVAWWTRFNDPILADLIARSTVANTSIAAGAAALRQARALRDVAAASLWPSLDIGASAQRSTTGIDKGRRTGANRFQTGLDANWAPDVFGGGRSAVRAANANAWASASDLGDIEEQIAAEIAVDYILLRSAQARLAIARASLASQQDTLQIAQWREQAGLANAVEVEQARASAAQTSAGLPLLQTTIDQTAHALAVLVGEPPAALNALLAAQSPALPHPREDLALSLPAETLRQRADVRSAEYQVSAARARVGQARSARWPDFSIGGSLGLSSLALASMTDGASVVTALLASVRLPIFDAGAGRGRVRSEEAALEQTEQAYRATVLRALQDVEDALTALRDDRARLTRLQVAADAGTAAATLARQNYASGLVDFQIVLETQRTELNTQDGVTLADAAVSADHVRLYKALGGGWRPDDRVAAASPAQAFAHLSAQVSR
ncbi:MAG: efflux transporter outer membrane subunit [Caulobacterales bacterium]